MLQRPNERFQGHLIRLGALSLVLAIVPAALAGFDLAVAPQFAIATHVAMLMYGVLLLCLGLAWDDLASKTPSHKAFWLLVVAGLLLFSTGTFAAVRGVGGGTLSAFDADARGTGAVEGLVRVLTVAAGLSLLGGLALIAARVWTHIGGPDESETGPEPATELVCGPWAKALKKTRLLGPVVERTHSALPTAPVKTWLFRLGVLLLGVAVLVATFQGAFELRGLSVAALATMAITSLMFMAMAFVWPDLVENLRKRVDDADSTDREREFYNLWRTPFTVLVALGGGAVFNLAAAVLAAAWGLHDDPLAVVSARWTSDLTQVLSTGEGVAAFRVRTLALIALVCNSIGVVAFAHGVYDRAERRPHTTMNQRLSDRLVRFGTLALVVGVLTAWLPDLSRLPRVAVGTYATLLIIGPMFICFGRVWAREQQRGAQIRLSLRKQRFLVTSLSLGALGIVVAGMVLALLGIGGSTLSISAADALGSEQAELVAKVFVDVSIFMVATAMIMFWIGLRPPSRTSFHRVAWAASIGIVAILLQAIFYHAVVSVRLAGVYPILLPDYGYGQRDVDRWAIEQMWDGPSGEDGRATAQNWTADDWQWFYHASQGGAFEVPIPYAWLTKLEQPTVQAWPAWSVGLLMDPRYLQRFGFLPNQVRQYDPDRLSVNQGYIARLLGDVEAPHERDAVQNNPDGLPVGFARTDNWVDQSTGHMVDAMGFTCAACHTSQLDYENPAGDIVRLRVEGGPANVDLGKFRTAVAVSLGLTRLLPGRFDRFADRLEIRDREGRRRLREDLDRVVERVAEVRTLQDSLGVYPTEEGFGRLDAIGRIFNFVFGTDLGDPENLGVANAPVNFPYLWDAQRFEWVQYNASFKQPMVRNAGQSMGVFASVDLHGAGAAVPIPRDPELFTSSIDLLNIHELELLLGGCTLRAANPPAGLESGCLRPFEGLESPRWPAAFPAIDRASAEAGRAIYLDRCAGCHLPPPDQLARQPELWETTTEGNSFLELRVISLGRIGTDPWTARNFATRQVRLGELGERLGLGADSMLAAAALPMLIDSVLGRRYRDYGVEPSLEPILEGHRDPEWQIQLGYRARPLNGVWATAPFLHNGSVPTLYWLLSPQSERPDTFYLGSRMFDPDSVGFDYRSYDPGYFKFDASLPGNSNLGHSFESTEDGRRGRAGVIGPELSPEERFAIIEYLKTLPPLPVRPEEAGGNG